MDASKNRGSRRVEPPSSESCASPKKGSAVFSLFLLAWMLLWSATTSRALLSSEPSFYKKQATWHETLIASRQALRAQFEQENEANPNQPFVSPIMHGGDEAIHVRVKVTGWKELFLMVDDAGDYHHDVANWGEAKLIGTEGTETFLDTIEPASVQQGWGKFKRDNQSAVGSRMEVAGRVFERGLGTHAQSVLRYELPAEAEFFEAWVGINDSTKNRGTVQFIIGNSAAAAEVIASSKLIWELVARDFNGFAERRQQRWEQQDWIWDQEGAGFGRIAQRYAARTRGAFAEAAAEVLNEFTGGESMRVAREIYYRSRAFEEDLAELEQFNFRALRMAITNLSVNFGPQYPKAAEYLERLDVLEKSLAQKPPHPGPLPLRGGEGEAGASETALVDQPHPPSRAGAEGEARGEEEAARNEAHRANVPPLPRGEGEGRGEEEAARNEAHRANVPPLPRGGGEGWGEGENPFTQIDHFLTQMDSLRALFRESLLANPLLDFDQMLLVRRKAGRLGLPANWQGNASLPRSGFDNEIAVFSPIIPGGKLASLHQPDGGKFVGDLKLHFDAGRLLFSSIGSHHRWQVFEIQTNGSGLRQVTPGDQPDVDNYDACYLPDERIIFCSTASLVGVPCVDGSDHVGTLYLLERDGRSIRQLCFDQDHNWTPAMLNNGRVLYQRWEYADTPHSQTRLLFHMNPDGTGQVEFYGSNSYWPNAMFYARAIPGHPSKVVAIVTGHHGVPRMGELVIFDPAKGRHEAEGVVQRIPGHGQTVEPIIRDALVDGSWPKFLHPYPLNENYFLVSAKPGPDSLWGIYLVDVFDNLLLLADLPGHALFEPVPLHKTLRPPVIPDRVDPERKDALVYLADVYQGGGLKGVPRGAVKELRLFAYHWAYHGMGGLLGTLGIDGPWDVRRILGTIPVEEDGSAWFRVPANTPISIQPLDEKGRAMQVMRSWMTAMPGENLSCVGCHEKQNTAPATTPSIAFLNRPPSEIKPWHGPARGFSFSREVQPVLDQHCVSCHTGEPRDGKTAFDLRGTEKVSDFRLVTSGKGERLAGRFSVAYANLHAYVRRPGIESDYHLLAPMEFHAGTTELVQLLEKDHHGAQLDDEAWDRLITWIDLNAPYHGTWHEELQDPGKLAERRRELRQLYAGMKDDDTEVLPEIHPTAAAGVTSLTDPKEPPAMIPEEAKPAPNSPTEIPILPGWPFNAQEASRLQTAAAPDPNRTIDLGDGVQLELVLIPAGSFLMGQAEGAMDERPPAPVRLEQPFWMGRVEVSNEQFARFDPAHDSRMESKTAYQFGIHGYPLNAPEQPAVRVTWEQAMAFCDWLTRTTGRKFSLPTEAQWEWACRAGAATPFWFGDLDTDFSQFANFADAKLTEFATDPYTVFTPLKDPSQYEDYIPKDTRFNDGGLLTTPVGTYAANPWGLRDMHGNVWEWTRTSYRSYPYQEDDGRNDLSLSERKVVRGGSWRDRPRRGTASYRLAYEPWQPVFNVGFRIICEPGDWPPHPEKQKALAQSQ